MARSPGTWTSRLATLVVLVGAAACVPAALTPSIVAADSLVGSIRSERDFSDSTGWDHIDPKGWHHESRWSWQRAERDDNRRAYFEGLRAQQQPTTSWDRQDGGSQTWVPTPGADGGWAVCKPLARHC
ncbi:hypothetical protein HLB23_25705 [Nocardia uniformis]|uniref:Secreted protein n=1 Tax=Nocardia uniformis TaxID=53432 RepID=A0A849CHP7_9NOCA|nr:hypothetical protein [Nocardia uniformis]NNH73211.1 hypothetical protein [Nocardia uniformis]